ncbi:TonB-dependent receptor [Flagellimonas pacifica]|uniref:Iron complex outermembrane recepter protein n=1 Tax=Flagellimonas pacifica TaxID=1247520 RepID=A0A285MRR6_9FLAO|nr:TonB-dependent receptor [Allomuricauda parva]SNY99818.1 iron complex outermembrane recepter protein [Allomuricauda parva]
MKALLLGFLLIIIPLQGKSQECKDILTGQVTDYHSKIPLENASILIIGDFPEVKTNKEGRFRIPNLCHGTYQLEISHPECTTILVEVTVEGNTKFDIKLEHHLEELDEVNVVGDAIKDKTNSAQEEKLRLKTLELYSSGNLGDALKELGGVSSLNTGANIVKPTIHGLNGSRVLILNDGVRMQDMEWGDEHAPNVDINASGSVSVIKGASALQFGGDAIGGVIVMEQAKIPVKDTLYGKTLINGVSNGRGGNITSELGRTFQNGWFVKGQGSFKRLGDHEAPDYILSNTGIQEIGASLQFGKRQFTWGWDARYSYFNSEIAVLRASHIGNVDDLIRSINSGQPEIIRSFTRDLQNPRQEVTHHLGKVNFYKRFEGLGKWSLQYDFQKNRRFEFDVRRGERDNTASIDLELTTHTLSTDFKWDAKEKYQVHAGLLGRYQENFANPDTGVRRLIPDYEKFDFGGFVIGEYQVNDQLLLESGLRYDFNRVDAKKFYQTSRWEERGYDTEFQNLIIDDRGTQLLVNPVFDYHNISATFGSRLEFNNNSNLKLNYSLSQRAPNPSELFSDGLHHSAARIELGDLRMDSETSHKITASFQQDFDHWGIVLEPYTNWVHNFMLLEPSGVEFTIRGAFPVWEYRQTNARLMGLDASAYVDWKKQLRTEHRFSVVKGRDVKNDSPLINIPSANFRNKITFTKPEWKSFELSLESQYVLQQNEVPENIMVFSPEQQQDVLLEINTAPEAYHLLGLTSKMEFPFGNGTRLTTSLVVNNLLDTNYREYLNRQRFFADDLGRNFILQLKFNY